MKIAFFNDYRLGIVVGNNIVDVTEVVGDIPHLSPSDLLNGLIEQFPDYRNKLEKRPKEQVFHWQKSLLGLLIQRQIILWLWQ